jgi:hypothetical protein
MEEKEMIAKEKKEGPKRIMEEKQRWKRRR